ncbi:MAG: DNA mismatch endonuclease Vsr [Zoogloeaceae bacterium]|jgi:DNA mismatch endonuclease (patch repair protein)|nr:DNA mismatch endonuclease Vsr [Zoogloeaceae bacterium]
MDKISPEKRSWTMARVKGKDTQPEKMARALLHGMGYRFRLQRADLPGKPDIVLPRFRTVVFVHGCFWHRHSCKRATTPASNTEYWSAKFAGTVARDAMNKSLLEMKGWRVLTIWECELKEVSALQARLRAVLRQPTMS